jgi:hypothetical protein
MAILTPDPGYGDVDAPDPTDPHLASTVESPIQSLLDYAAQNKARLDAFVIPTARDQAPASQVFAAPDNYLYINAPVDDTLTNAQMTIILPSGATPGDRAVVHCSQIDAGATVSFADGGVINPIPIPPQYKIFGTEGFRPQLDATDVVFVLAATSAAHGVKWTIASISHPPLIPRGYQERTEAFGTPLLDTNTYEFFRFTSTVTANLNPQFEDGHRPGQRITIMVDNMLQPNGKLTLPNSANVLAPSANLSDVVAELVWHNNEWLVVNFSARPASGGGYTP